MPVTITLSDIVAAELRKQLCNGGTPPGPTVPPPSGGGGQISYSLDWKNTTTANRLICQFTCNDMISINFKTPASTLTNAGNIGMAQYQSGLTPRFAVISKTPWDFTGQPGVSPYNAATGTTLAWSIQVGGTQQPFILLLDPDTFYYINVKNTDCTAGQDTTMSCDLHLPT